LFPSQGSGREVVIRTKNKIARWHFLTGDSALECEGNNYPTPSIKKGDTLMKRIPTLALFALAVLTAIPGAMAQDAAVKAKIPFGFAVGQTYMPAGEYTISSPVSGFVRIANNSSNLAAMAPARHAFPGSPSDSKLVFERYGDRYFLHRVLCPTTSRLTVDLTPGKWEKTVQGHEAKLDQGEEVLVAAE
jgi:hypothetical protein